MYSFKKLNPFEKADRPPILISLIASGIYEKYNNSSYKYNNASRLYGFGYRARIQHKTYNVPIYFKDQTSVAGPAVIDKDQDKLVGLCVDCEARHNCTFPKSEGGVWHCEEYR